MNSKTFSLVVLLKWFELAFQITMVGLLCIGTVQLSLELHGKFGYLLGMSAATCVLALYHVAYNNLLTNLRFRCKISFAVCCGGYFCYELPNWLFCFPCLKTLCMDSPKNMKFFWVKWIVKVIYIAALTVLIFMARPSLKEIDELAEEQATGFEHIRMEVILIVYLLQYVIFFALRPVAFVAWTVLTCWCPPGHTYVDEDIFDWSIISYDFIEHRGNYFV